MQHSISQVIERLGGVLATAKLLGVRHPAVCMWKRQGGFPALRAIQIEKLTKGKFKAKRLPVYRPN